MLVQKCCCLTEKVVFILLLHTQQFHNVISHLPGSLTYLGNYCQCIFVHGIKYKFFMPLLFTNFANCKINLEFVKYFFCLSHIKKYHGFLYANQQGFVKINIVNVKL